MNININSKTAESKISAVLNEIQAKCKVRTVDFYDIIHTIESVEKKISIPKCRLDGTTIIIDIHSDDFPSAYKYIPMSTKFSADNRNGKWYITKIWRGKCSRYSQRVLCNLSDGAKIEILKNFQSFPIF